MQLASKANTIAVKSSFRAVVKRQQMSKWHTLPSTISQTTKHSTLLVGKVSKQSESTDLLFLKILNQYVDYDADSFAKYIVERAGGSTLKRTVSW